MRVVFVDSSGSGWVTDAGVSLFGTEVGANGTELDATETTPDEVCEEIDGVGERCNESLMAFCKFSSSDTSGDWRQQLVTSNSAPPSSVLSNLSPLSIE